MTAIEDGVRVDCIDGEFQNLGDSEAEQRLADHIEDLRSGGVDVTGESQVEYDLDPQERLEDLGYL